jgi:sugar phosphate isomerase/epimerase
VVGVTAIRLAVQSRLSPGRTLAERYETARRMGFDGMELSVAQPGPTMIELAEEAIRDGIPVTAMCSGHRGWLIDPDPAQIRLARDDIGTLLELGGRLAAPLIIVPIYGRTRKFAACGTGRTPEADEALWLEGLRDATDHAEQVGGTLLVEPINRYENSVSVTVADAVRWARAMDSPAVRMMGDVFHMNIEEADIGRAFEAVADDLAYVHLGDSQRLEPGQGHLDFDRAFAGLARAGYEGWASMECNLSGPAEDVLPVAVEFVRRAIELGMEEAEGIRRGA